MKRSLYCILILSCLSLFLMGCGESEPISVAPAEDTTEDSSEIRVFESDFGYSMEYDPSVFYVLTDPESDSFGLWDEDADAEVSVSINVERVRGYTVSEYVDSITSSVESGVWSVTEAEFGADHKNATTVMYEDDHSGISVYHTVTLVKNGSDIFVVETVTHDGVSETVTLAIREMLNTFQY
ncbi:MAG: hypothetical protein IJF43_09000 [Firmicutes bacterium]|nr:hypothetical protein [Bacillota bacterium]